MQTSSLLSETRLSLISAPFDAELEAIAARLDCSAQIGGRGDLEEVFCELMAVDSSSTTRRTLDLIGHSTPDGLLRLGSWVIDANRRNVTAFFRGVADHDVLGRLGIEAVRLLGCETATTGAGRATICAIAEILGVEVFGSRTMIGAAHYTPSGFGSDFASTLIPASELRGSCSPTRVLNGEPYRRTLDVGALPASPVGARAWPVAVATTEQAREVVQLIRRNDGAYMPGDARPELEIGIPSMTKPGWYHLLQVIQDGAFVRVFPDAGGPGVVFPVTDPARLQTLARTLERR